MSILDFFTSPIFSIGVGALFLLQLLWTAMEYQKLHNKLKKTHIWYTGVSSTLITIIEDNELYCESFSAPNISSLADTLSKDVNAFALPKVESNIKTTTAMKILLPIIILLCSALLFLWYDDFIAVSLINVVVYNVTSNLRSVLKKINTFHKEAARDISTKLTHVVAEISNQMSSTSKNIQTAEMEIEKG